LQVRFLGAIPLDASIVESGDKGVPVAAASPDSPSGQAFFVLARALHDSLAQVTAAAPEPSDINLAPDGNVVVAWSDGHAGLHTPRALRLGCACASCVSEDTGKPLLDPARVPQDIKAKAFGRVGRYGISFLFSDNHNTGIYTHEHLRALCECPACAKKKSLPG